MKIELIDNEPECFVPLIGYEGLYWISQYGRIKTFNWRGSKREAILRPAIDNHGYLRFGLMKNGKLKTFRGHRLVALMFHPNPDNKEMVNHKDLNKVNNFYKNLEWTTPKENTQHAIENGAFVFTTKESSVNKTIKRGELNGCSLLTEQKVREIRSKFQKRTYTRQMLADEYGVTANCIKDVCLRKSWKHVI